MNEKVERLVEVLQKNNTTENLDKLMETLEASQVFVPGILPMDTDPAIVKSIMTNQGKNLPLPEGVSPKPAILENQEGLKFLPIFTSHEQIQDKNGIGDYPLILGIPFQSCVELMMENRDLEAMVINPFSHNMVLNINVESEPNQEKSGEFSQEQLHAIIRQQVEANELPKTLFEKPADFIHDLNCREGECILDFYQEPYKASGNCPYAPQDFDLMTLNIRDDFQLLRVNMPTSNLALYTCPSVFITWNPLAEEANYFAVVKGKNKDDNRMIQVNPDGSKTDLGPAPAESNELNYILELMEK